MDGENFAHARHLHSSTLPFITTLRSFFGDSLIGVNLDNFLFSFLLFLCAVKRTFKIICIRGYCRNIGILNILDAEIICWEKGLNICYTALKHTLQFIQSVDVTKHNFCNY